MHELIWNKITICNNHLYRSEEKHSSLDLFDKKNEDSNW